ncbi:hypothetical protein Q1695_014011 [Nippostrongylus brasiliensis]|nr:hypothetical protein Q1695_014011 [Nippostrongylus brasiliensis]
MRPLLLLAAFVTAVATTELVGHDIVRHVLKTWDARRPVREIRSEGKYDESSRQTRKSVPPENSESEVRSSRSKRSVGSNFISPTKACNTPGFTGEFCEFPICFETNNNVPDIPSQDGFGASIDGAILANCTQKYVVLVDETMTFITFFIESETPVNPTFYLQGEDGTIFFPDEVVEQTKSSYGARYLALAPGQYLVGPSADLQNGYCQFSMRAHTDMTLQGGFILGQGYDLERSDYPNTRFTYYQRSSPMTVHVNRNRSPGSLTAISFVGESNAFSRPKLLGKRYNCAYEYIFESFYCEAKGYYYAQVEGISFQGYNFRRILPFNCIVDPTPTVAPTTTPAPTQPARCQNGGVLVTNLDGSTYCYCTGLFSGTNCQTRLCSNGGTTTALNTCLCADGYDGQHCENVVCSDSPNSDFNANQPTLTFVIRARTQLNDVIEQVIAAASAVVNELNFDPDYIKAYVLVLFNNNKLLLSQTYGTFDEMQVDLIKAEHSGDDSGNCTDAVFSNVAAALQRYLTYNSPVYVITDALPNDFDAAETVFHLDSYFRVPLNFIFVEQIASAGCMTSVESNGYRAMDSLAKRTGGMTFYFSTNRTTIQQFMYQHMINTIYRSQLLLSNDLTICSNQNVYNPVSIDVAVEQLVIIATGKNLGLVLTSPDGDASYTELIYSDGTNYIWTKNGPYTGNWFVNVWTSDQTAGCNFKVLQKFYNNKVTISQQYDLFWGMSPRLDSDSPVLQPQYGLEMSVVVRLEGFQLTSSPEHIQPFLSVRAIRDDRPTTVYSSNGIWRDGCRYKFYFPPLTCQVPNEILYFNVKQPTPQPPDHYCQNGGIMNAANTTCFCPPGYTGTYCQQVECYNGGTPAGSNCRCAVGWTGAFCEIAKCVHQSPSPDFWRTNVDMVFILELTQQAHAQVYYLSQGFADLIRDIQSQQPNWITRFVVAGYNSTWADILHVSPSSDPSGVIDFVNQLALDAPTDTGCVVQLWKAIDQVSAMVRKGSYLEIFTASPQLQTRDDSPYTAYDIERSKSLRANAFINAFEKGYACSATDSDFAYLSAFTHSTTGYNYPIHPLDLTNALRMIPMQFSSGIVFSQYKPDCIEPMQMFFPIDAYTQTIQLSALGFNKTLKVFDGNGSPQETMTIISDPITGWDVLEIRKACDQGWDEVQQYCMLFVVKAATFNDAVKYCHEANGILVDDLSQEKNNYLLGEAAGFDFWLGLSNMNNTGYVWDRPDGVPALPLSTPTFWVNGVAPTYDANKECVYWDSSQDKTASTWTPVSCGVQKPFICQKHRYNVDNSPNVIGDLDVPAGKWYATVSVAFSASTPTSCFVEARVQSDLQVVPGFVNAAAEDDAGNDPIQDSANNRIISYVHSLDNANRSPILTHALLNDAYNGTFYNAATYAQRVGCSYPWMSQTFSCPNSDNLNNEFTITHMGEDEFGNLFQRVTYAHCSKETITCNGGVRWNGFCVCTEYWTGSKCDIPICVNGGTLSPDYTTCLCPNGYTGPNCQYEVCLPPTSVTFSPNAKTFVLVVEVTTRNKPFIDSLIANLGSIVSTTIQQYPSWFSNYALVTYDSTGVKFQYFQYSTINALVLGLNSNAANPSDPGTCSMPLYGALKVALSSNYVQYPNSEVFVATSAGVNDGAIRTDVVELIGDVQAHFTYMYNSASDCGVTPTDGSLTQTTRLAYASSGNVLFTPTTGFSQMFSVYLPTLWGSYVLTNPTGHQNFQCSTPNDWYVEVDYATSVIYVTTMATYGTLGVIDPIREHIEPAVLYKSNYTKVYSIEVSGFPGVYTLSLVSPGDCYVHVYAVGGAKVYYDFAETTPSDPTASHTDGMYGSPEVGVKNVLTLHSASDSGTVLKQVELFNPDTLTMLMRSPLYRRMNCSYEYYSDPFVCNSEAIAMFVYGEDDRRQPFRRQELTYCSKYDNPVTPGSTVSPPTTASTVTPPTVPSTVPTVPAIITTTPRMTMSPGTTTTPTPPSPIAFDMVVVIDVSKAATFNYDDTTQFVMSVLSAFTVSQEYARVAVVPVFGDAALGPLVIANLNAIGSSAVLQGYFDQTKAFNDFDSVGQYLAQSLGAITTADFKNAGYRTGINHHLILYITSTSGFTDQPLPLAQGILQSGDYGIITVGYGPGIADKDAMQNIAGGASCSFYGANLPSLRDLVQPVQELIKTAAQNGGKYCGN